LRSIYTGSGEGNKGVREGKLGERHLEGREGLLLDLENVYKGGHAGQEAAKVGGPLKPGSTDAKEKLRVGLGGGKKRTPSNY